MAIFDSANLRLTTSDITMRQRLLFIFLTLSLSTFGQLKFPKDTITNFSLRYVQKGGLRDGFYSVEINSTGKINVISKIIGGETVGKKEIQLDANTFRQFKNSIVTDYQIYSLKDSLYNDKAYDSGFDVLVIKSNLGQKTIKGYARGIIDADYKAVIGEIEDLIGKTIGDDSDAR
jgi:hypothetical protein